MAQPRIEHSWQDGVEGQTCYRCKTWKPLADFNKERARWDGLSRACRQCQAEQYAKGKERYRLYRIEHKEKHQHYCRERLYGVTREIYDELYDGQGGCCAICGIHQSELDKSLSVDHDHETEEVRGLLCSQCNFVLGFAHDSVEVLRHAIQYLER